MEDFFFVVVLVVGGHIGSGSELIRNGRLPPPFRSPISGSLMSFTNLGISSPLHVPAVANAPCIYRIGYDILSTLVNRDDDCIQ